MAVSERGYKRGSIKHFFGFGNGVVSVNCFLSVRFPSSRIWIYGQRWETEVRLKEDPPFFLVMLFFLLLCGFLAFSVPFSDWRNVKMTSIWVFRKVAQRR